MNLFGEKKLPKFIKNLPNTADYNYSYNEESGLYFVGIPNGEIIFSEFFFNEKISDRSMNYFLENNNGLNWKSTNWRKFAKGKLKSINFLNIKWQHDQIKMFGKDIFIPRYSAWYGDSDKPYTYSGLTLHPKPWNKGLNYIKNEIEKTVDVEFNSVLLNWYRDGEDSISWHTDSEKELGKNPVIGSVNFGAARKFILRRIDDKKQKIEISLGHGTLLIMKGEMQHYWQHSVPKEKKIFENRINLTFRKICR